MDYQTIPSDKAINLPDNSDFIFALYSFREHSRGLSECIIKRLIKLNEHPHTFKGIRESLHYIQTIQYPLLEWAIEGVAKENSMWSKHYYLERYNEAVKRTTEAIMYLDMCSNEEYSNKEIIKQTNKSLKIVINCFQVMARI
jgi:hypothetical protein